MDDSKIFLARLSKHGGRKAPKKRVYLMPFWRCTIRTSKKKDWLCVVKVKFHVYTGYKNMKSALLISSFSPALVGEDNEAKIKKIFSPSTSLIIINSASYKYCELE